MSEPSFDHQPVMRDEIVDALSPVPSGVVLDATLGGAGHSEALLESRDDIRVLGLDRDGDALAAAWRRLAPHADRVMTQRCRFDELDEAMRANEVEQLSGALFDLGVSSPQLDRAERGFSYRNDGPLDMRMDTDARWSADDVVNGYAESELADIIRRYGDERFARRIAAAIVAARPIESTTRLAEVITTAIPAPARRTGGHPAKRTFQAIRIEVNGELDALPDALDRAIDALVPGRPARRALVPLRRGSDRQGTDPRRRDRRVRMPARAAVRVRGGTDRSCRPWHPEAPDRRRTGDATGGRRRPDSASPRSSNRHRGARPDGDPLLRPGSPKGSQPSPPRSTRRRRRPRVIGPQSTSSTR